MRNPILSSTLFKTPESLEELTKIAESMDNASQAWMMLTFTMNYCHSLVEQEINAVHCVNGDPNCTICV